MLEWAAQEESLEDLRKKTAEHFHGEGPVKKQRKLEVLETAQDDD